ncbi:MAG: gamma-glutamyl-gamma-aminobutyrate hydrolase family protein [Coriobacteriales bacterium]|nr:gamma-glutamyl-gamma-aminobutyrate hydrolase family protein [Coriobacteriales bacterium]
MKPIIGLSPLYNDKEKGLWMRPGYLDVLYACGAIPLVLPFDSDAVDVEQMLSLCDGLLLTGGADVNPRLYGEAPIPECGPTQFIRDDLEFRLLEKALRRDMPIFGVCRGSQILNVFLGGTLYQDLRTQVASSLNHAMEPPYEMPCHRVRLEAGQPLRELLGEDEIPVNSIHHQAVKDLAPDLVPLARALDGVIEGSWMPSRRFVWAVQWHPEWIWDKDARQQRIVQRFVDACKE